MFYRINIIRFEDDRFGELLTWAESVRNSVESIDGLVFAEIIRTGTGTGIAMSAYRSEADYQAAADMVSSVLGEMREFLIEPPQTHSGDSSISYATPQET